MDYVKDITLKYQKLNRPKLKNPCKDAKIIHEILNGPRSTKQKGVWEILALDAKRWLLMRTKSDEHRFYLLIIKVPEDTEYVKKHVGKNGRREKFEV